MNEVNKEELRRLAEAFRKTKMNSAAGLELLKRWIDLASPEGVLSLLDEAEYREDKGVRAERNRDMWKDQCSAQAEQLEAMRAELEALRKDARRWQCVRNAVPMQSPYAVWREGTHVVLGKDADELVDNFLSSAKEGMANE